jgi:hypothetical protein
MNGFQHFEIGKRLHSKIAGINSLERTGPLFIGFSCSACYAIKLYNIFASGWQSQPHSQAAALWRRNFGHHLAVAQSHQGLPASVCDLRSARAGMVVSMLRAQWLPGLSQD